MIEPSIEIGEPVAGWIPVSIRIGDDEWSCHASYVFDCISELVYAALELSEMRDSRPVVCFEEPHACRLSMVGDGDAAQITVTKHRDVAGARSATGGTVVLSRSVRRSSLTRAIYSAVTRLEAAHGRTCIEAEWRAAFPAKELAQLGERVRIF